MAKVGPSKFTPSEAVKFFKQKGYGLNFHWRDVAKEEHANAFFVSKATGIEVLETFKTAIEKSLENGTTFEDFKKDVVPTLQKLGWIGKAEMFDPRFGKTEEVLLGTPRRLKVIYDTNLRTAYSAGTWERILDNQKAFPYLRYSAVMDSRTRPEHSELHGITLPVDDPFWDTHYPPNGWFCRCTVMQVSRERLEAEGWQVSKSPEIEYVNYNDKRNGVIIKVPKGIDPSFDYNVGKARRNAFVPPSSGGSLGSSTPHFDFKPYDLPENVLVQKLPPMPKAETMPASLLLPSGKAEEFYMNEFLKEFSASTSKDAVFIDKTGQPLVIGKGMFLSLDGKSKVLKAGREPYLKVLAETIKNPDEIWWVWEKGKVTGNWLLKRRYLKRWEGDGGVNGLAVFEWNKKSWLGITTFVPSKRVDIDKYLKNQRQGLLAYYKKTPSR
jgi:SPP1 gp7 family putative phage head morphogenesis protein